MKLYWFALLAFLLVIFSCSYKEVLTPKKYLTEVLELIEEYSINKDSVDMEELKRFVFEASIDLDSIDECYPVVDTILKKLKDNHSFLMTKEDAESWSSTSGTKKPNELITFKSKMINQDIGYIQMKRFSSGDSVAIQKYADSLQQAIELIDNISLKGWIIDLRENSGGNCWPMLSGIGPLLGNGICGYFIDNKGEKSSWFYKNGESGIDSVTIVKTSITPYELLNESNPIAVLTGDKTASSGELVVTAFHNKSNTKSFGEHTGGYSTGNAIFDLSDGSKLALTTAIYADREGEVFGKKIEPDEIINFSYASIGQSGDTVIAKAIDWIYQY